MAFCTKCGHSFGDADVFCAACGQARPAVATPPAAEEPPAQIPAAEPGSPAELPEAGRWFYLQAASKMFYESPQGYAPVMLYARDRIQVVGRVPSSSLIEVRTQDGRNLYMSPSAREILGERAPWVDAGYRAAALRYQSPAHSSGAPAGQFGDVPDREFVAAPFLAAFCALLTLVGSIGTWVKIGDGFGQSFGGLQFDGTFTLIVSLAAAAAALSRGLSSNARREIALLAVVCFLLLFAGGANYWAFLSNDFFFGEGLIDVGWGIPLLTIAAFIGGAFALADLLRQD